MKQLLVFFSIAIFGYASDLIEFDKVQNLAQTYVSEQFGTYYLDDVITYYGLDELPGAYALVFRNQEHETLTIVMGARYTTTPISEIRRTVPRSMRLFDRVVDKARSLGFGVPEYQKTYYFGPGHEYCAFTIGGKELLINANTFQTIDKVLLTQNMPQPNAELERLTRQKWERYFSVPHFAARQDTGYIAGVPFIDWVYGCGPTAASMVFWYWDSRGYGRLVDHFFTHWDNPENEWNECANVNRELAIAMNTDTMTGSTTVGNTGPGMLTVANAWHGYSCGSATSPQGGSGNQHNFSWIKNEVNAGRPFCWGVLHYHRVPEYPNELINHCVTGVGYAITATDTFVQVHNTWDNEEPYWDLWTYYNGSYSYDYVITFVPGGAVADNIALTALTWPLTSQGVVIENMRYRMRWENEGSNINAVKIWYSEGRNYSSYDSLAWTVIENGVANTGEYIWTAPVVDSSIRINIAGLNASSQRLAADGIFNPFPVGRLDHSPNMTIVGHYDTPGLCNDVYVKNGAYAYLLDGTQGLCVVSVIDSSLPEHVNDLSIPGDNIAMTAQEPYLYILDKEDTLRVVSISNSTNPTQIGTCYLNVDEPQDICVSDTLAYVACRATGIVIVNIKNPSSPSVSTTYDTPGQAYSVLVSDTLAYVADGTTGILILNVADPSNPVQLGSYNTDGVPKGLALNGLYLYVADGNPGIKVFDISDPANPQLLGSCDTPGSAKHCIYSQNLVVADAASGMRLINVSNPAAPSEIEYIENLGMATDLVRYRDLLYLADVTDGLYIVHCPFLAINETTEAEAMFEILMSGLQSKSLRFSVCLPQSRDVVISLYDVSGRMVQSFTRQNLSGGTHEFTFSPPASGVYFVSIDAADTKLTRKVAFIR